MEERQDCTCDAGVGHDLIESSTLYFVGHHESALRTNTSTLHAIVWARLASLKPAASICCCMSAGGWTNVRNGCPRRRLKAFSYHTPSLTYQRSRGYESAMPRSACSSDCSRSGRYAG